LDSSLAKTSFVSEAEKLIKKAVKSGDFDSGFQIINELYEQAETFTQVIGSGLDMMESAWDKFDHEESFLDAAVRKTKLNPITIRNRVNVRKLLNSDKIPEIYRDEISDLGQKSLIRIANTSMSGYEIEDEDWRNWAESVSDQQVDSIARKIEKKSPRSNFVGLYWKKSGELLAFVEGELVVIGQMSMDKDPKVTKAREVLIARAKILDRVEY
jgi:hypothetical protein